METYIRWKLQEFLMRRDDRAELCSNELLTIGGASSIIVVK